MFFLAFLPQFVVAARGDAPWQIAQLSLDVDFGYQL
jgi:threonine/homoserine/homoserine lactone efflux protein